MPITLEVSTTELMDLFDCGRTTIVNLMKSGVIKRTRRGHFDLREASRAYARHHSAVAGQHHPQSTKEAALAELVALRRAQRTRIEKATEREEVAVISREEHHRSLAICAFSFRAAFQAVSDKIGRRLNLSKSIGTSSRGWLIAR